MRGGKMKIDFSKPMIVINAHEFKAYCKKGAMKQVYSMLRGEIDY